MLDFQGIRKYLNRYGSLFKVYQRQNTEKAQHYLEGLFHEGKHNIERMNERIENSDYQQLHHFISVSPWDHRPVIKAVRSDISRLFKGRAELTGLILDESGHLVRTVSVYSNELMKDLSECDGFMWRYAHWPNLGQIARRILPVIENVKEMNHIKFDMNILMQMI